MPCGKSALVDNCLWFRGLTEAGQGKTPLLFHGVIGQVSFMLFIVMLFMFDILFPGHKRLRFSELL